ncbi:uncharacterized protein LOC117787991 [Drosophila innubila]|uniref:uncharacterized protein LOC117787991 n=1 Tax=Drosophila innubila TaxID=198719 RepID=UPI00148CA74D|nr:uncharacterized protein LOC117787991 [Drosophila innubila]
MEIRIHFAVLVSICLGVSQSVEETANIEITDLSHICNGRAEDNLVPHPFNCNAYFACSTVPTLFYCDQGLIFDEDRLECDVPEKAHCSSMNAQFTSTSSGPNGYLDSDTGIQANIDIDWWEQKPQPIFVAVDVSTGEAVSPMEKYDPQHIECRHFGAYFLPHPKNCQLYFICAYGHLHRHQCGIGTLWNYKSSECQISVRAECYGNSNSNLQPSKRPMLQTANTPSTTPGQVTVCYIVSTSSSLTSERETTTSVTAPSPTRASQSTLICPSERQSYLPHATDCSKYYICIAGMPVLTSCPKGLFWDQKSGYCDQAKNVKCFQNE